jgi:3-dehydroquinate dehydratase-1
MKNIKIRKMELGVIPRVVGIIDRPIPEARLKGFIDGGVDMFEVRVDLFNKPIGKVIDYIKTIRKTIRNAPLIGTIRETDFNRADRAEWYVALAPHVDCLDIELGIPQWREIIHAIMNPTVIMVSEHDFNATPDLIGLDDIVKRAVSQGAEIVKIAAAAHSVSDVTRLLRFTEDCETPLVSIAMGNTGAISRVIAPLFGSLFTYGHLRAPVAPGQMPAIKLAKALSEYFPARK